MAALAREGPLDTREITQWVMAAKGLNDGDEVLARSIALRIVRTSRIKRTKLDGNEKRKGVSVSSFFRFESVEYQSADKKTGNCDNLHDQTEKLSQFGTHSRVGCVIAFVFLF
jgi:hypothetical protein